MNQLEERFKGRSNQVIKVHLLIPSHLNLMNDAHLQDIKAVYESDMPSPSTISQELRLLKRQWTNEKDNSVTVRDTLKQLSSHVLCNKLYPNIPNLLGKK